MVFSLNKKKYNKLIEDVLKIIENYVLFYLLHEVRYRLIKEQF